jgi:hypothetical protein
MILSLCINLALCFQGNLFVVAYIFLIVRIGASWSDRPFIMVDIEDKFIVLLSTDILWMAVLELFWILVAKLIVCDGLYVVNNEASCFFGCFQWDNLWLYLHKLRIQLHVYTYVSKYHLDSS